MTVHLYWTGHTFLANLDCSESPKKNSPNIQILLLNISLLVFGGFLILGMFSLVFLFWWCDYSRRIKSLMHSKDWSLPQSWRTNVHFDRVNFIICWWSTSYCKLGCKNLWVTLWHYSHICVTYMQCIPVSFWSRYCFIYLWHKQTRTPEEKNHGDCDHIGNHTQQISKYSFLMIYLVLVM